MNGRAHHVLLSNSSLLSDQQGTWVYSQALADEKRENEYGQKSRVKGREWKEQKSEGLAVSASLT